MPSEILFLNQDLSDKVLISTFSTSVVTPLTLYGKKVKTIFLYKILSTADRNPIYDSYIEKLRHDFNGTNYFIPKSKQELFELL
ncbi:hypothetical protein AGMMS49992_21100 [Clostridia bacterium]|nr:hypothetical protein AGMMS49992_21100 [Clostridia bacterium]